MLHLFTFVLLTVSLLQAQTVDYPDTSTPAQTKTTPPPPTPAGATPTTTTPAPATPQPLPTGATATTPVPTSYLVSNVAEFSAIYERMVTNLRYPRAAGHVVAASRLVNCLFNNSAVEKADYLDQVILSLGVGTEDNIRRRVVAAEARRVGGDIRNSAQAAHLASVLLCKMGTRKYENLAADFDAALAELMSKMDKSAGPGVMFPFFQLISVAELMN